MSDGAAMEMPVEAELQPAVEPAPQPAAVIPTIVETMDSHFHYFRYYCGHMSRHGNEFLELELNSDGTLKYANNSNYRKDSIIKKQVRVSESIIRELQRMALENQVLDCDDSSWPEPDRNGRQELEIRIGQTHISLVTNKTILVEEIENSRDPAGLGAFHYFVKDAKRMMLSLMTLHFKLRPVDLSNA